MSDDLDEFSTGLACEYAASEDSLHVEDEEVTLSSPEEANVESGGDDRQSDQEVTEENEDDEGLDIHRWSVLDATSYLYSEKVKHCISDNAFAALWVAIKKVLPILSSVAIEYLPSAQTIKRHALEGLPEMKLEVAHKNVASGEEVIEQDLHQFPKKKYEDREEWEPLYEVWRTDLMGVLRFHTNAHGGEEVKEVIINVDGVPIGRTGRSQTIVSMQFTNCRNVYQLVNAIPSSTGKKLLTVPLLLRSVTDGLQRLGMTLKYISADAPMRATLRNQKSHAGRKACDYCYGEAGHKRKPIWSVRTLGAEERTYEKLLRDYDEHDRTGRPLEDFGYKGKSHLIELLPGFDIIENIPVDSMHLLFLGVARALFELIFHVGENRETNRRVVRPSTSGLDKSLAKIRVASEIGRRPKPIDFKNYKASEWRNLVLYYFPVTLPEIPTGIRRQLWLEFCYLCRAFSLDEESFAAFDKDELQRLVLKWYRNYNHEFGSSNMRYNIHLLAHIQRIRVHGPFSETSAFGFEGSFAASTRAQRTGTTSMGLQSMRQSYIRPREGHMCRKKLKLRDSITARSNDTLIYTLDGKFQVEETRGETLLVKEIIVSTYFPPLKTKLDFSGVGVHKYLYTSNDVTTISIEDVKGKLLAVDTEEYTVLLSATKSMLLEAD